MENTTFLIGLSCFTLGYLWRFWESYGEWKKMQDELNKLRYGRTE